MIVSSASAELRTVSVNSRCSESSDVSSKSPVIPTTPFIGVRISWLMFARNSLLAFEADSAALADLLTYAATNTGLTDFEIERTIQGAFGARGAPA